MFAYLRMENPRVNAANVSDPIEIRVSPQKGGYPERDKTSAFRIVYLLVKIEVISAFKFKRGCFGGFSIRAVPLNFSASACDLFRHWRPRNRLRGRGNWQFAVANDERFKIIIVGSIILSNCNLFYYLVTPIVLVQYIFYFVVEILRNSILKM